MLNTSHSLLAEEETDMNNNRSSFAGAGEEENLSHAVYDTALFDVLKVDAEDFAVRDQFVCPPID